MTQATGLQQPQVRPSSKGPPPTQYTRAIAGVLTRLRKLQAVVGLIGVLLAAIVLSPHARDGSIIFLDTGNLTDIVRQVSEIGIIAIAMTFVILTAGIDLSVGSTLALAASVTAMGLTHGSESMGHGLHIALAVAGGLAVAGVAGFLNGLVISRLAIQPFIVTLAAMIGLRGLARWLTNNTNIDFGSGHDMTAVFADLFSRKFVVISCFVGLALVFVILLKRTVFGRHVRAVGDNERAALYAGLPITRTKIWVYSLCGLLSGLAGVLHAAQVHQGNPNDGVAYELEAIAAVVIGGTSLSGGKGTIIGTIVGTLIMGILTNILRLRQIDPNREMIIKAVIIVVAVWAQSRKRTT